MSLYVYLEALSRSAQSWEDQGEVVRGGRKSLGEVDASLLGARVQPAAQAFIDAWMKEMKRLEDAAADHGRRSWTPPCSSSRPTRTSSSAASS